MQATYTQLARTERDLTAIAKEAVKVEQIGAAIYALGSELATLRIFAKYNSNGAIHNSKVRYGYSENRKSFYFVIEL